MKKSKNSLQKYKKMAKKKKTTQIPQQLIPKTTKKTHQRKNQNGS